MLIKYLRMTIAYLLGDHDSEGNKRHAPPVVLRGNPDFAQRLTDQLTGGDRYTSFVFMDTTDWETFGGRDEFERFANTVERDIFAGMEKHEYHALWVGHPRKDGKTEVNLYIPNVHLPTGKKLKSYYAPVDKRRLQDLMEIYSRERGLSCARDPRRRQACTHKDHLPENRKQALEIITKDVVKAIYHGQIRDRSDVVCYLEGQGYTLARKKKVLSIKSDKGKNLRLHGWPFDPDFDAGKRHKDIRQAYSAYCLKDEEQLRQLRWHYARQLVKRRRRHRERYHSKSTDSNKLNKLPEHTDYHEKFTGYLTQFIRKLGKRLTAVQANATPEPDSQPHTVPAQGFFGHLRRLWARGPLARPLRYPTKSRRAWMLGHRPSDAIRQWPDRDLDR